ncbi:putative cGMP-inhibited 3',5'-cyclic phosphodiesterase [Neospora caninum Liverpool]|uniref:Phosphodiesterase n=1 Tax=Neospora caninum (strain Liverpool) TaxID=572307 RepID=F0VLR3_NEOCL|nr:putative cGMP-inhibited 3',5'-cyclic phosphodiesterase [Neospora caninum Liverpool]CBZ54191.1 putative cGMP-inhibited 3',5'-cyclic phosphodiesterase [Neospora caninum Liverpool]CEL68891.1 TPA: cGMP-inhibited 3',5'-cyclic phosphodiesterase,putative [Neospora caninum Liverpool]|eukprot:XP_003884222.1 putative cGMP-inhibited 3',5'-cyclic phosphodiesterase [Neospora caninum Liverpool]
MERYGPTGRTAEQADEAFTSALGSLASSSAELTDAMSNQARPRRQQGDPCVIPNEDAQTNSLGTERRFYSKPGKEQRRTTELPVESAAAPLFPLQGAAAVSAPTVTSPVPDVQASEEYPPGKALRGKHTYGTPPEHPRHSLATESSALPQLFQESSLSVSMSSRSAGRGSLRTEASVSSHGTASSSTSRPSKASFLVAATERRLRTPWARRRGDPGEQEEGKETSLRGLRAGSRPGSDGVKDLFFRIPRTSLNSEKTKGDKTYAAPMRDKPSTPEMQESPLSIGGESEGGTLASTFGQEWGEKEEALSGGRGSGPSPLQHYAARIFSRGESDETAFGTGFRLSEARVPASGFSYSSPGDSFSHSLFSSSPGGSACSQGALSHPALASLSPPGTASLLLSPRHRASTPQDPCRRHEGRPLFSGQPRRTEAEMKLPVDHNASPSSQLLSKIDAAYRAVKNWVEDSFLVDINRSLLYPSPQASHRGDASREETPSCPSSSLKRGVLKTGGLSLTSPLEDGTALTLSPSTAGSAPQFGDSTSGSAREKDRAEEAVWRRARAGEKEPTPSLFRSTRQRYPVSPSAVTDGSSAPLSPSFRTRPRRRKGASAPHLLSPLAVGGRQEDPRRRATERRRRLPWRGFEDATGSPSLQSGRRGRQAAEEEKTSHKGGKRGPALDESTTRHGGASPERQCLGRSETPVSSRGGDQQARGAGDEEANKRQGETGFGTNRRRASSEHVGSPRQGRRLDGEGNGDWGRTGELWRGKHGDTTSEKGESSELEKEVAANRLEGQFRKDAESRAPLRAGLGLGSRERRRTLRGEQAEIKRASLAEDKWTEEKGEAKLLARLAPHVGLPASRGTGFSPPFTGRLRRRRRDRRKRDGDAREEGLEACFDSSSSALSRASPETQRAGTSETRAPSPPAAAPPQKAVSPGALHRGRSPEVKFSGHLSEGSRGGRRLSLASTPRDVPLYLKRRPVLEFADPAVEQAYGSYLAKMRRPRLVAIGIVLILLNLMYDIPEYISFFCREDVREWNRGKTFETDGDSGLPKWWLNPSATPIGGDAHRRTIARTALRDSAPEARVSRPSAIAPAQMPADPEGSSVDMGASEERGKAFRRPWGGSEGTREASEEERLRFGGPTRGEKERDQARHDRQAVRETFRSTGRRLGDEGVRENADDKERATRASEERLAGTVWRRRERSVDPGLTRLTGRAGRSLFSRKRPEEREGSGEAGSSSTLLVIPAHRDSLFLHHQKSRRMPRRLSAVSLSDPEGILSVLPHHVDRGSDALPTKAEPLASSSAPTWMAVLWVSFDIGELLLQLGLTFSSHLPFIRTHTEKCISLALTSTTFLSSLKPIIILGHTSHLVGRERAALEALETGNGQYRRAGPGEEDGRVSTGQLLHLHRLLVFLLLALLLLFTVLGVCFLSLPSSLFFFAWCLGVATWLVMASCAIGGSLSELMHRKTFYSVVARGNAPVPSARKLADDEGKRRMPFSGKNMLEQLTELVKTMEATLAEVDTYRLDRHTYLSFAHIRSLQTKCLDVLTSGTDIYAVTWDSQTVPREIHLHCSRHLENAYAHAVGSAATAAGACLHGVLGACTALQEDPREDGDDGDEVGDESEDCEGTEDQVSDFWSRLKQAAGGSKPPSAAEKEDAGEENRAGTGETERETAAEPDGEQEQNRGDTEAGEKRKGATEISREDEVRKRSLRHHSLQMNKEVGINSGGACSASREGCREPHCGSTEEGEDETEGRKDFVSRFDQRMFSSPELGETLERQTDTEVASEKEEEQNVKGNPQKWQSGEFDTRSEVCLDASLRRPKPAASLARVGLAWTLDLFSLDALSNGNVLVAVGLHLLLPHREKGHLRCSKAALGSFLQNLQSLYLPNLYHNRVHAATVAHLSVFLSRTAGLSPWPARCSLRAKKKATLRSPPTDHSWERSDVETQTACAFPSDFSSSQLPSFSGSNPRSTPASTALESFREARPGPESQPDSPEVPPSFRASATSACPTRPEKSAWEPPARLLASQGQSVSGAAFSSLSHPQSSGHTRCASLSFEASAPHGSEAGRRTPSPLPSRPRYLRFSPSQSAQAPTPHGSDGDPGGSFHAIGHDAREKGGIYGEEDDVKTVTVDRDCGSQFGDRRAKSCRGGCEGERRKARDGDSGRESGPEAFPAADAFLRGDAGRPRDLTGPAGRDGKESEESRRRPRPTSPQDSPEPTGERYPKSDRGAQDAAARMIDDETILCFAALGHDVGHPGFNNAFLVATNQPIALVYNDHAVLENYHAYITFRTLTCYAAATNKNDKGGESSVLKGITPAEYRYFRKHLIELILATDMSQHFSTISTVRVRRESRSFNFSTNEEDRWMMKKLCIKIGDIGHAALEWDQHYKWSMRVTEEFLLQGDAELKAGLPVSPLCDRKAPEIEFHKSQSSFINYLVVPLINELVGCLEAQPRHSQGLPSLPAGAETADKSTINSSLLSTMHTGSSHPHSTSSSSKNYGSLDMASSRRTCQTQKKTSVSPLSLYLRKETLRASGERPSEDEVQLGVLPADRIREIVLFQALRNAERWSARARSLEEKNTKTPAVSVTSARKVDACEAPSKGLNTAQRREEDAIKSQKCFSLSAFSSSLPQCHIPGSCTPPGAQSASSSSTRNHRRRLLRPRTYSPARFGTPGEDEKEAEFTSRDEGGSATHLVSPSGCRHGKKERGKERKGKPPRRRSWMTATENRKRREREEERRSERTRVKESILRGILRREKEDGRIRDVTRDGILASILKHEKQEPETRREDGNEMMFSTREKVGDNPEGSRMSCASNGGRDGEGRDDVAEQKGDTCVILLEGEAKASAQEETETGLAAEIVAALSEEQEPAERRRARDGREQATGRHVQIGEATQAQRSLDTDSLHNDGKVCGKV